MTCLPLFLISVIILSVIRSIHSFSPGNQPNYRRISAIVGSISPGRLEHGAELDDETLLKSIKKAQLVDLCVQLSLDKKGTKSELLMRLRQYANRKKDEVKARRTSYVQRVEEGFGEDTKERYEIVNSFNHDLDDDDDEDDVVVFLPDVTIQTKNESSSLTDNEQKKQVDKRKTPYLTQADVTTPPMPPGLEPNEDGELVVTTYSTTDLNDLTGIAAAQPGQLGTDSLDAASAQIQGQQGQPWDMENVSQKSKTTNKEIEKATETVTELVQLLLATTGAPAFRAQADDHLDESEMRTMDFPTKFVGFDPSKIPTHLLSSASKALRTGRGQVLSEVLRQFEIQAIGQDGVKGDNKESGGGHYREVSKVRAFLEGFRRAEVRKMARETTTILLDKLVQEGVEGLDMALATMTRSSDDNSDHAGELNDSLLDYLNDAIRQQEKKVDQLTAERFAKTQQPDMKKIGTPHYQNGPEHHLPTSGGDTMAVDPIDALWNVTTEDGQRVESLDPTDPNVKAVLEAEFRKQTHDDKLTTSSLDSIPDSAPEKILLLLSLLKERVKAEAAFAPDEKGRNLRLLAHCMKLSDKHDREQLLAKDLASSLERLDSFIELVESSIEYGESTSYQLQPARTTRPLDVRLLRRILEMTKELRSKQAWKASTLA